MEITDYMLWKVVVLVVIAFVVGIVTGLGKP
jgi:hypothetical protein